MGIPQYLGHAISYFDDWFECQKLYDRLTPGYSVAVSYKGEIIYSKGFGFANKENSEPVTTSHLFRIASHSKTFTATAIMQLMEAGKLSIHDPAAKYLTFLKDNPDPRMREITIQQMLSHSSGIIRDGTDARFWRLENHFPSKEEIREVCVSQPLIIENNTRFKYSNYAYGLLGWIIEEISGLSYEDYMQRHILEPLGLAYTGARYNAGSGPYVTGYTYFVPDDGRQVPVCPAIDTNGLAGATGFYSNPESLCRFYSAVMPGSGKLLSDNLKKEMLRRQWPVPGGEENERYYAMGFDCPSLGIKPPSSDGKRL
jgi:CubicO group peptidase (beta-lactamase class C family)